MKTTTLPPTNQRKCSLKSRQGLIHLLVSASLLLTTTLSGYAQNESEAETALPNRVFLPLVVSDLNHNEAGEQGEETAAPVDMGEDGPINYEAILDEAVAETIEAAAVGKTFFVTKTDDTNDGVCSPLDCSLREAVHNAGLNPATYDQIFMGSGLYQLKANSLNLVNLALIGNSASTTIIKGIVKDYDEPTIVIPKYLPFNLSTTIERLTITNAAGNIATGIRHQEGTLTLKNVKVEDHKVGIASWNKDWGTAEQINISNSVIVDNGLGLEMIGSKGSIHRSAIVVNPGTGIRLKDGSTLAVTESIIAENARGVEVRESTLSLYYSEITKNKRGAIWSDESQVTVSTSTISNNSWTYSEEGLAGVPIGNIISVFGGVMNLDSATVAKNTPRLDQSAIYIQPGNTTLNMRFSIVADNINATNQAKDCAGTVNSQGYNLIESITDCTIVGSTTGNILSTDPQLGNLQANGNFTHFHLPAATSPVVDVVPTDPCAHTGKDQRLLTRPRDGNGDGVLKCDMGAVER